MAYAEPWRRPLFGDGVRAATGRGDGPGDGRGDARRRYRAGHGRLGVHSTHVGSVFEGGHSGEPGRQRGR